METGFYRLATVAFWALAVLALLFMMLTSEHLIAYPTSPEFWLRGACFAFIWCITYGIFYAGRWIAQGFRQSAPPARYAVEEPREPALHES